MNTLARLMVLASIIVMGFTALSAQEQPPSSSTNDYKIGPKDLLEISVFGLPELTQTVRVAQDGSITMPLLGKVDVAGLTAQELEKQLAAVLDKQFTKDARVMIFIREYQKVSVIGAVGRPGQYQLVGPTTLVQIIAEAGGITGQAMEELFVYRQGPDGKPMKIAIRIEELISKGDQTLDIGLHPNDIVSIPMDQTLNVFVYGEVNTQGAIPYLASKGITLLQAIAQAGGTTEWARRSAIVIKRKDTVSGKEIKIRVDLNKVIKGNLADVVLEEGDVIIVP